MGYFSTPAEAQRWVQFLLPHYPDAFVNEMRKLIPHVAADEHELPMDEEADELCQPLWTTPNARSQLG
jgi:hypothetical protein